VVNSILVEIDPEELKDDEIQDLFMLDDNLSYKLSSELLVTSKHYKLIKEGL
jgi:hypothetical protein